MLDMLEVEFCKKNFNLLFMGLSKSHDRVTGLIVDKNMNSDLIYHRLTGIRSNK